MKQVEINIDELTFVMEMHDNLDSANILDTETGEVLSIYRGMMEELKNGNGHSTEGLPKWLKNTIEKAKRVYISGNGRYKEIPRWEAEESYQLMQNFTESVTDSRLRSDLEGALENRFAPGSFFRTLSRYPREQERWFALNEERIRQRLAEWLASLGIEPLRKQP